MAPRPLGPVALALVLGSSILAHAATLTSPAATNDTASTTIISSQVSTTSSTATTTTSASSAASTSPAVVAPDVPSSYLYTMSVRPLPRWLDS